MASYASGKDIIMKNYENLISFNTCPRYYEGKFAVLKFTDCQFTGAWEMENTPFRLLQKKNGNFFRPIFIEKIIREILLGSIFAKKRKTGKFWAQFS